MSDQPRASSGLNYESINAYDPGRGTQKKRFKLRRKIVAGVQQQPLSRRQVLGLVGASVLGLSLAACASAVSNSDNSVAALSLPDVFGDVKKISETEAFEIWKTTPIGSDRGSSPKPRTTEEFMAYARSGVLTSMTSRGFQDLDLANVDLLAFYSSSTNSSDPQQRDILGVSVTQYSQGYTLDRPKLLDSIKGGRPDGRPGADFSWFTQSTYWGLGVSTVISADWTSASEAAAWSTGEAIAAWADTAGLLK